MKMFMVSLEGNARLYEGFPIQILYSLREFHLAFHEHFKNQYPSLLLVRDCCTHDRGFIEQQKGMYGEEEFMDEEILEIYLYIHFKKKEKLGAMIFRKIPSNWEYLLLSLQETTQGYKLGMPGNLRIQCFWCFCKDGSMG